MASPSIFSSQRYGPVPPPRAARSAQASSSSAENELSRLSSRCRCSTGVNRVETDPPTCCVGESGVRSSGKLSSSPSSSRISTSNSASEIVGASRM